MNAGDRRLGTNVFKNKWILVIRNQKEGNNTSRMWKWNGRQRRSSILHKNKKKRKEQHSCNHRTPRRPIIHPVSRTKKNKNKLNLTFSLKIMQISHSKLSENIAIMSIYKKWNHLWWISNKYAWKELPAIGRYSHIIRYWVLSTHYSLLKEKYQESDQVMTDHDKIVILDTLINYQVQTFFLTAMLFRTFLGSSGSIKVKAPTNITYNVKP